LPTGDGFALVFFTDPEAPVRTAVEVSRALKQHPEIKLRMGIHSGFVNRIADIDSRANVAGVGINIAQRVMDCGDAGHILLSKRVADDLLQLARWSEYLQDLGNAEVKHGVIVYLFNLRGSDFGNPDVPEKLRKAPKPHSYKKAAAMMVMMLAVVGLIAGLRHIKTIMTTSDANKVNNGQIVAPKVNPERALVYWLLLQKTQHNKAIGEPLVSAGDIQYQKDWALQFNVQPTAAGALYLLNVGRSKDGSEKYNILYPIPSNGKINPNLAADQTAQTSWLQFMDESLSEKFWIIWSTKSLPDVNAVFGSAAENGGVIANANQIAQIRSYINQYDRSKLNIEMDKSKRQTSIKGQGDILVALLELTHTDK
jgi:hypothetical protein